MADRPSQDPSTPPGAIHGVTYGRLWSRRRPDSTHNPDPSHPRVLRRTYGTVDEAGLRTTPGKGDGNPGHGVGSSKSSGQDTEACSNGPRSRWRRAMRPADFCPFLAGRKEHPRGRQEQDRKTGRAGQPRLAKAPHLWNGGRPGCRGGCHARFTRCSVTPATVRCWGAVGMASARLRANLPFAPVS